MNKENIEPQPKRKRLSLSLKNNKKEDSFASITRDELEQMSKYKMPKNSELNSKWAMKNLADWVESYKARNPDKPCPLEILSEFCNKSILNEWLCVYINETRNQKGESYCPRTLYALLCGISREMKVKNSNYPNFLDKNDKDFALFTTTLDNLFKHLRKSGVGANSSHTEDISKEDEEKLWSSGVLNVDDPNSLLRAVFFTCGKCFCLRGGQEHRDLILSQLERAHNPDRYIYHENASKNKQGGLRQMRVEHKVVTIIANPSVKEKCPVFCLTFILVDCHRKLKTRTYFIVVHSRTLRKLQPNHGILLLPLVETCCKPWCAGCVKKLAFMDRRLTIASECVGQPAYLQLVFLSV